MLQLIRDGFMFFANETGIAVELWRYEAYGLWAAVLIGAAACLLGIRVYRGYCAVIVFCLTAAVSCILMRDHAGWRAVVTCFSVTGISLAFLVLFWNRLDACLFCSLIGGAAGWILFHSLWAVIPFALVCLILTLTFPLDTVRVMTAVLGSWILWDVSVRREMGLHWLLILPAAALGYLVQRLVSRNQTLFKKVRPDRMTHWLEERERKKKNADRVSQGN